MQIQKKERESKMLKFKGKIWEQKCFMQFLIYKFGEKATLKEVIEKAGK